jgi:hypothetical protein
MSTITIGVETEGNNHWSYQVQVQEDGARYDYQVTLSWSDYDLWSHGRKAPQYVVRAVFEFLLARGGAKDILPRFDCATVRRRFPDADEQLPRMF